MIMGSERQNPETLKPSSEMAQKAAPRKTAGVTLRKVAIAPFVFLIRFYQVCLSPLKGGPSCRFTPTCSQYALEAFRKHGPFKGLYLSVRRILRCHPWGGHGYDPVP
jgi:putative membrane protein insertion efficiency factor